LLQLMPATARYMAESRRRFRGRNRAQLFDPGLNLRLGQKYLDYLLAGDVVSGNLVLMIAAYNGGPGNLAKWQRQVSHGSDPLVFIETIPVRETRLFVQRVLENVWVYRARLGQQAPSLEALAGGRWPNYVSLDGARFGVAEERP
jgi:soluble lytic murein transglycosylase